MTFDEFTSKFGTEDQCRDYLFQLRWPKGFVCPKGRHNGYWKVGKRLFECTVCGHQSSVTAGTIFQDTRKPLKAWFTAIWWLATHKGGASAKGLQQVLGLKSYETAWTWLHKIRKAMVDPNQSKLCGEVEVDMASIGEKGKLGRIWVAVEVVGNSKPGRVRLSVIRNDSPESLAAFAANNIEKSSAVSIDSKSRILLESQYGFRHTQSRTGDYKTLLPHMQIVVTILDRWLMGTHHGAVKQEHLQDYLDEFAFRFNHRDSANRGLLFYDLLECAMNVKPVTLDELIGKPKKMLP